MNMESIDALNHSSYNYIAHMLCYKPQNLSVQGKSNCKVYNQENHRIPLNICHILVEHNLPYIEVYNQENRRIPLNICHILVEHNLPYIDIGPLNSIFHQVFRVDHMCKLNIIYAKVLELIGKKVPFKELVWGIGGDLKYLNDTKLVLTEQA